MKVEGPRISMSAMRRYLMAAFAVPDRLKSRQERVIPALAANGHLPRWPHFSWLPCLLFPVGYLLTVNRMAGFEFEYLALTVISMACSALCITALQRPLKEAVPAWTIFAALLVAYYMEFYEVVVAPWTMLSFAMRPSIYNPTPRIYLSCFATITIALMGFSAGLCLRYGRKRHRLQSLPDTDAREPAENHPRLGSRSVRAALAVAILLIIATSALVLKYDMVMSMKKATPLPFHLEGVVVYLRAIMIPSLLLLVTYMGIRAQRQLWKNGAVLILVLYAFSDMLLRASKGTLAIMLLYLAMLWITTGQRVGRRQVMLVLGIVFATIVLFPVLEVFRGLRNSNHAVTAALLRSIAQNSDARNFKDTLSDSVIALTMRLTGTGALLSMIELGIRPLGLGILRVLRSPLGMQGYITFDVFGASLENVGSFGVAPSLLGYFYVLGAKVGVGIGMLVFTIAVFGFWNFLGRLKLRTLPVAQAMFLFLLFGAATEGTLDIQIFKVGPIYFASILMIEALCFLDLRGHARARRFLARRRTSRVGAAPRGYRSAF